MIRSRHHRSRLVAVAFLAACGLVLPGLAHQPLEAAPGSHDLHLAHLPLPVALAGSDLPVIVGVASDCGILFCRHIEVELQYVGADGDWHEQRTRLAPLPPAHLVTFTIPGADVDHDGVRYRIVATQDHCGFFPPCTTAHAAAPRRGTYRVMVVG